MISAIRQVTPLMTENIPNLGKNLVKNPDDARRIGKDFGFPVMLFPLGTLYGEGGQYIEEITMLHENSCGMRRFYGNPPIVVRAAKTLFRAESVMEEFKCPIFLHPYGKCGHNSSICCLGIDKLKMHFNEVCSKSTNGIVLLIIDPFETKPFNDAGIF